MELTTTLKKAQKDDKTQPCLIHKTYITSKIFHVQKIVSVQKNFKSISKQEISLDQTLTRGNTILRLSQLIVLSNDEFTYQLDAESPEDDGENGVPKKAETNPLQDLWSDKSRLFGSRDLISTRNRLRHIIFSVYTRF